MADGDPGLGQPGLEGDQQGPVVGKVGLRPQGVALPAIGQITMRQPLAPPFVDQDNEPPLLQIAHHLEVLLDGLGPARREDDRAAGTALGAEQGGAQSRPAFALEPLRSAARRDGRIGKLSQRRRTVHVRPVPSERRAGP